MSLKQVKNVVKKWMDTDRKSYYHIKMPAWQELQEALKIKRINDELLEYLTSSLRYLVHYSERYNIHLPEHDKIGEILNRIMAIAEKLPTESQQRNKTTDESTEPNFVLKFLIQYDNIVEDFK